MVGIGRAARVVMERVAVVAGVTAEATTDGRGDGRGGVDDGGGGGGDGGGKGGGEGEELRTGAESAPTRDKVRVLGVNCFVHSMPDGLNDHL